MEPCTSRLVRSKSVRFSDGITPPGAETETRPESEDLTNGNQATTQIKKKSTYLLSKKYKISNSKLLF